MVIKEAAEMKRVEDRRLGSKHVKWFVFLLFYKGLIRNGRKQKMKWQSVGESMKQELLSSGFYHIV